MDCHLDNGASVSALPAEVSGGTIRRRPLEELGFPAEAQPARTSKASTAVRRGFVNLVPTEFSTINCMQATSRLPSAKAAVHFVFAMFDVDEPRQIVDFILKFAPNQQIFLHRHLALTNTLVVQGEHRLYEPKAH